MSDTIIVKGITYKYFGGHFSRATARVQAKSLRRRGHLATVRYTPKLHFPWTTYWYDRSSRRQLGPKH